MSWISIDIEADGPVPGPYSMVNFGAVIVEPSLKKTFYGEVKPISTNWIPDALAVSGISREQHLKFGESVDVMFEFDNWIKENSIGKPVFVSDNPGFDFPSVSIKLFDMFGKIIFEELYKWPYATLKLNIPTSNIPSGIYYVAIGDNLLNKVIKVN